MRLLCCIFELLAHPSCAGHGSFAIPVGFVELVALVSLLLMPVELCSRCLGCAADVIDAG